MVADLRETIFRALGTKAFVATVTMHEAGVVCGVTHAVQLLAHLGCKMLFCVAEGNAVLAGECVLQFTGTAGQIAMAEDCVLGALAKPSGIARAAAKAVALAKGRVRIVAGAAKKLPREIKPQIRHAVYHGGAGGCISAEPFVYLDKNYVRMFGNVEKTLQGVCHMHTYVKVIQLRGLVEDIATETQAALAGGAAILMIDTGNVADLDTVAAIVQTAGKRKAVTIAFAGGIRLEDIDELCAHDVDILDIGRPIIDASLADCRLDVTGNEPNAQNTSHAQPRVVTATIAEANQHAPHTPEGSQPWVHAKAQKCAATAGELDLLDKTEILLEGIFLEGVNLTALATQVADVLHLPADKLTVIDVRSGQVALDVLVPTLKAEQFFGREKMLLESIASLPGVCLAPHAYVHSRGILGAISLNAATLPELLENTTIMQQQLTIKNLNKSARIVVFPTGFELIQGNIEDTNTPYLCKILCEAGFMAEPGAPLPDSREALICALAAVAPECRAIVTTGGVGAEDKDVSVEAIEALDPQAATPYLVRFPLGGRHVKEGIRIGVGQYKGCTLIALPGPHDEVRLVAPLLVAGLKTKQNKHPFAEGMAVRLREKLRASSVPHAHCAAWKH